MVKRRGFGFCAIMLIVALFLSGCTDTANPVDEQAQAPYVHPKGSVVISNGVAYSIKSIEETKEYNDKKTENKFIVLNIRAENRGNKQADVTSEMFYLLDDKDRQYEGNVLRDMFGDKYFGHSEPLPAGLSKEGRVAFEVPNDSIPFTLAISTNAIGFGDAEYTYVYLSDN